MIERPPAGHVARLGGVALVWLLSAQYLVPLGIRYAPRALQEAVSFSTFRLLAQVATLSLGLALSLLLVPGGRAALGLRRPAALAIALAALSAPLVMVVSTYVALGVAMPTLLAEVEQHGRAMSQSNAGGFGRELVKSSLPMVLLTGVVLGPVGEELLFRGALFGAVSALAARLAPPPRAVDPELPPELARPSWGDRARAWLAGGGAAVIVSAAVFGWMHADLPGGVGIVRVVSTTCLGLACGAARATTGTVAAAIALHVVNNLLSVGQARGWFAVGSLGAYYGVPGAVLALAGACAMATLGLRLRRGTPT